MMLPVNKIKKNPIWIIKNHTNLTIERKDLGKIIYPFICQFTGHFKMSEEIQILFPRSV